MRLFHDLDYGFFTAVRGGSVPLRRLNFKAGDAESLEVEFFRSGVAYVPASLDEAIFVIKDSYAPDATALALVETGDWSEESDSDEESQIFTAALDLNTVGLRAAVGSEGSVNLKGELSVTLDGIGPCSTAAIPCVFENDLWKGDEATPLPLPTPEDWLTARAVRYDAAQSLTSPQQAQARSNIGVSELNNANVNAAIATSPSTTRTALGLGNAATLTVDADLATFSLPAFTTISTFGASLVDDADAAAARTTLGLGTAATSNTENFAAATHASQHAIGGGDPIAPGDIGAAAEPDSAKATALVDADRFYIYDSAAANIPKTSLWSLIKSTLKTYFDTLYDSFGSSSAAQADAIAASAHQLPVLRDNFARYANNTIFTHQAQDPEIGGDTNWRVFMASGSDVPRVVDDAVYGRGLVGQAAGLYYMGNTVPVPIRSLTMELSLKSTGSSTGFKNGLTFAFGTNLVPTTGGIGLQTGMVHFPFTSGNLGNSIANAPSASFDGITADGEPAPTMNWFFGDVTNGLAPGNYTLKITFEPGQMTFAMAGRLWRWRDARFTAAAAGGSFFFETAGPTGYDDVWIIHSIAVNDDSDSAQMDGHRADFPGFLAKSLNVAFPAKQTHELAGTVGSFTKGARPSNAAHRVADFYYTEKGVIIKPWGSSDGTFVMPFGFASSNTSNSPAGTDQLWTVIGNPKLATTGNWSEKVYMLNFPNTNSKQFKFRTTGGAISELTMPAFTDSGVGTLTIRQHQTSTVGNQTQITLEVVTDATAGTTKKWIRNYAGTDGEGNKGIRIMFTGVASGDAVILGSTAVNLVQ